MYRTQMRAVCPAVPGQEQKSCIPSARSGDLAELRRAQFVSVFVGWSVEVVKLVLEKEDTRTHTFHVPAVPIATSLELEREGCRLSTKAFVFAEMQQQDGARR